MTDLTAVLNAYPHTRALLDDPFVLPGGKTVETTGWNPLPVPGAKPSPLIRMLQNRAFDIGEVPLVGYMVSRETRGDGLLALPIFVTRAFDHVKLVVNRNSGILEPIDLVGKRIGVRNHGFTDGVWARGLLETSFGVELDSITWVTSLEETIVEGALPSNVDQRLGADLDKMLVEGEIDAAITTRVGIYPRESHIAPLFSDLPTVEREWFEDTGVFPIHHVVVMRSDTLEESPQLANEVFTVFSDAKRAALDELESGRMLDGDEVARAMFSGFPTKPFKATERPYLGPDPLPYGLDANAGAIQMLIDFALRLRILTKAPRIEDLFAPNKDL